MSESLTPLLFIVSLSVLALMYFFREPAGATYRFEIFQPIAIVGAFHVVYVLFPFVYIWLALDFDPNWARGGRDPDSVNAALFLHTLGFFTFAFGYWLSPGRRTASRPRTPLPQVDPVFLYAAAGAGLFVKVFLISQLGGLDQAIQRLSPSFRAMLNASGATPDFPFILIVASTFADGVVVFLMLRAFATRTLVLPTMGLIGLTIVLNYLLSGKRSTIVILLMYAIGFLHVYRRRIGVGMGVVAAAALALMIVGSLVLRVVLPQLSYGMAGSIGDVVALQDGIFAFYLGSPELALIDMVVLAVQEQAEVLYQFGGSFVGAIYYNFAAFGYLVPRALWTDKPEFVDTSHVMFRLATGRVDTVGFSLGFVGYWFIIAGLLGVSAASAALGYVCRLVYSRLDLRSGDWFTVFLYFTFIWYLFQFLRFGTLGYTFLLFVQTGMMPFLVMLALYLNARYPVIQLMLPRGSTAGRP